MLITFCGVRGSTPAPGADYVRYGGNTSCVAVAHAPGAAPVLALDAGTGLANLTGLLGGAAFAGTILLTHLHWDHCLGLPFFRGGDRDDARVTLLLPEQGGRARAGGPGGSGAAAGTGGRAAARPGDVAAVLPDQAAASCAAAGSSARSRRASSRPRGSPSRPGRSRTRAAGRSATGSATAGRPSPTSPTTAPPASGLARTGSAPTTRPRVELARDADLLIHDAQLTAEEVPAEAAWGHAAAEYAVGLAVRAGARRVALFHHKPSRTDEQLDAIARRFAGAPLPVLVAAEGLSVEL